MYWGQRDFIEMPIKFAQLEIYYYELGFRRVIKIKKTVSFSYSIK